MKRHLLLLLSVLWVASGCGYRLAGTGQGLPPGSKTIAIPEFRNTTQRFQAEDFVSTAVRQEFLQRSRLHLSESVSSADLLLEGTIRAFDVWPVAYTENIAAFGFQMRLVLEVQLVDLRTGQVVFEDNDLTFTDTYETAENIDFFSQETDKLEDIAKKMAETVVATILDNF